MQTIGTEPLMKMLVATLIAVGSAAAASAQEPAAEARPEAREARRDAPPSRDNTIMYRNEDATSVGVEIIDRFTQAGNGKRQINITSSSGT